nr:glycoside hydrolase family 20 zincin-like fold domain-containing protein [uncultured Acetatifactor sp.]
MILLPMPKKVEEKSGNLVLRVDTAVVMEAACPREAYVYAKQLKEEIFAWAGLNLDIRQGSFRKGDVSLSTNASLGEHRYTLNITEEGAFLVGGSLNALGWAVQTLRQIVRQDAGLLPFVEIDDEPDMKNRGFYHDVTRGRIQNLDNLKKLADKLCFYKMNQLQLYVEHSYLYRDLTELWRDDTPLTAEEIIELDEYCYERGIELVPSIATFGHLYKLLGTKGYQHLCELPDSAESAFSFRDRMAHHTVNVSDSNAMELVKELIEEYMHLFRTDKFNICADETFDLGKGRSAELAKEKGTGQMYLDYIMELFDFLIQKGKVPMFWGDIISGHPDLYPQIPKEVICLTWGYAADQSDWAAKILYDVNAVQYLCPGVCGWNTWVNYIRGSYENIVRMCNYARKYNAIGILNTDWGDFGHINHPAFSVPGLIYGAVGSWGEHMPEFDELNRQISVLEYGDASGQLVGLMAQMNGACVFSWHNAVTIKEWTQQKNDPEKIKGIYGEMDMAKVPQCNKRVEEMEARLREVSRSMDSTCRGIVECAHVSLEMIRCWNEVGVFMAERQKGEAPDNGAAVAAGLERCLHYYQRLWRENGKEGDLMKVSDVFFWYADILRSKSNHCE